MLQQTQMDRGVVYFNKWVARFPEVRDVAEADIQEILKMWEGLGYYARARNLHKAAQEIVIRFGGLVPCDIESLKSLPGIGPYTAAAIGSVACNIDIPVVDANVSRIFSRIFDIARPIKARETSIAIEQTAISFLPLGKARFWNQALMDLGGLICTPKAPRCTLCPVASVCKSLKAGTTELRPVAVPKKTIEHIERVTLMFVQDGKILIESSERNGLWQGLWELPSLDLNQQEPVGHGVTRLMAHLGVQEINENISRDLLVTVKHSYTRFRVQLHCYLVGIPKTYPIQKAEQRWCSWQDLQLYGFSAGSRKLFEYILEKRPDIVELLTA